MYYIEEAESYPSTFKGLGNLGVYFSYKVRGKYVSRS
jgi:hypothetical protein